MKNDVVVAESVYSIIN